MAEEVSLDRLTGSELITIHEMMMQERKKSFATLGTLMQQLHGVEDEVPEKEHFVQIEQEEA